MARTDPAVDLHRSDGRMLANPPDHRTRRPQGQANRPAAEAPAPGRVGAAALALNAAWELAHWPLYECQFTFARWLRASLGDAVLTAGAAAGATRVARGRSGAYLGALTGALTVLAAGIELHAHRRGRWCYRPAMPTLRSVGLSPLLQLPLAGAAAAALAARA